MPRLAVVVATALVLLLPAAARGAACSPLNCAPSQFVLAHGTMLAVRGSVDKPVRVIDLRTGKTRWRLPPGVVTRTTLVHQDGGLVTWYDLARGTRLRDTTLKARGAFTLVGTSQDASRAVLARTQRRSTTFVIASPSAQRTVRLAGKHWQFDALNGPNLYLIETLRLGYQVRLYDLRTNRLQKEPLKDPDESALISGLPFARASSPDGRYLFTLYIGGDGNAMIHELDTAAGFAYCIDLPGRGDFNAATTWALVPDVGSNDLWAVSTGYGRVVAIDGSAHLVRERFSFTRSPWLASSGTAVLAPDGEHIAVTDARHTWYVTPATASVRRGPDHVAIALGFSPDERRLWVVGERSRVSSLPVRWVR
jgi:WD40 repeat protein